MSKTICQTWENLSETDFVKAAGGLMRIILIQHHYESPKLSENFGT